MSPQLMDWLEILAKAAGLIFVLQWPLLLLFSWVRTEKNPWRSTMTCATFSWVLVIVMIVVDKFVGGGV